MKHLYLDKMPELPFQVAENKEELQNIIALFDTKEYSRKVSAFRDRVGLFNDGHASERTVKYILKRIEYKGGSRRH